MNGGIKTLMEIQSLNATRIELLTKKEEMGGKVRSTMIGKEIPAAMYAESFVLHFFLGSIRPHANSFEEKCKTMHLKFGKTILFVICIFVFGCEKKEKVVVDFRELKREGLIDRGWVPKEISKDFANLVLTYDLDVNKGCGKYSFKDEPFSIEEDARKELNDSIQTPKILEILDKYCPEGKEDFLKSNPISHGGFILFENNEKRIAYFLIVK